uniref:Threonylcarbamoyl-AMP synthase n=1 Tax=Tetradesmus obliquus TaxID=3088 RepID=A0A383VDS0_TETOB|eukprot:jgi/Sobl393_1/17721/SZX63103.1
MLLKRQPAAGALVVCGQLKDLRSSTLLSASVLRNSGSARSLKAAGLASGATCTTTQQQAPLQAADMVTSAASQHVSTVDTISQAVEQINSCSLASTSKLMQELHAAAAINMQAVAAAAVTEPAAEQDCLGQQQQQHHMVVGEAEASAAQAYCTQLLAVNPAELPAAEPPAADLAQQLLATHTAPELSREACPHLYYTLPEHLQQQQQQQLVDEAGGSIPTSSNCSSSAAALQQAAALLRAGLPVAMPTETVYGLAGNALSGAAVASIFAAKGRPADNPLIVHVSDLDMLAALYPAPQGVHLDPSSCSSSSSSSSGSSSGGGARSQSIADIIPQQYHRLIAAFWPGPLTILLPASPLLPAAITAGQPTVAVRMPAHPVARALIAAAGVPLAAPSANTSGRPSPTSAQHVLDDLAGRVPAVVDGGGCGFGVESTVLDGLRVPPVVLRPGGVTAEQLAAAPEVAGLQVYARDFRDSALEAAPTTPGMKYRHYSPSAPVLLLDPAPAWQQQQQGDGLQQQAPLHSTLVLQQLVSDATQQLLQSVQQGQLQELAAARPGNTAQRVVLLSTCASGKASSSTCSKEHVAVGWTPESLALLQMQQQGQQQGQQCNAEPVALPACHSKSAGSDGCCDGSSAINSSSIVVLEYVLGSWQQPELVAQQLFGALRAADDAGASLILVQGLPPVGTGLAVMNRLQKAASRRVAVDL